VLRNEGNYVKESLTGWHWWLTPIILVGKLRSEGSWLKASLDKQFQRPSLQNNQGKMDWRYGSSDRAPALQV
jgi:hypothetical protein